MTLTSATMAQQSADPATARAKERRNLGFSRELQQDRTKLPKDPSHGGSAGYPVWFREQELQKVANGEDTTASSRSHERWAQRLIPYQQTGNHPSQALVGRDQWLLCILLTIIQMLVVTRRRSSFTTMAETSTIVPTFPSDWTSCAYPRKFRLQKPTKRLNQETY
jgi:hypothetical protein